MEKWQKVHAVEAVLRLCWQWHRDRGWHNIQGKGTRNRWCACVAPHWYQEQKWQASDCCTNVMAGRGLLEVGGWKLLQRQEYVTSRPYTLAKLIGYWSLSCANWLEHWKGEDQSNSGQSASKTWSQGYVCRQSWLARLGCPLIHCWVGGETSHHWSHRGTQGLHMCKNGHDSLTHFGLVPDERYKVVRSSSRERRMWRWPSNWNLMALITLRIHTQLLLLCRSLNLSREVNLDFMTFNALQIMAYLSRLYHLFPL